MEIKVILDTVCPWSFIGKRRLEKALTVIPEKSYSVSWEPFQINPTIPVQGLERRTYLEEKFGSIEHANKVSRNLQLVGSEMGIDFNFEKIMFTPNTVLSHRLIQYASRHQINLSKMIDSLFIAFFKNGEDIGSSNNLKNIAVQHDLNGNDFLNYISSDGDHILVLKKDEGFRRMGIQSVPCFIIDGKYTVSGAQPPEIFHKVFDLVQHAN